MVARPTEQSGSERRCRTGVLITRRAELSVGIRFFEKYDIEHERIQLSDWLCVLPLDTTLNKLTIKVDRPQLSPADIKKFEEALKKVEAGKE